MTETSYTIRMTPSGDDQEIAKTKAQADPMKLGPSKDLLITMKCSVSVNRLSLSSGARIANGCLISVFLVAR